MPWFKWSFQSESVIFYYKDLQKSLLKSFWELLFLNFQNSSQVNWKKLLLRNAVWKNCSLLRVKQNKFLLLKKLSSMMWMRILLSVQKLTQTFLRVSVLMSYWAVDFSILSYYLEKKLLQLNYSGNIGYLNQHCVHVTLFQAMLPDIYEGRVL